MLSRAGRKNEDIVSIFGKFLHVLTGSLRVKESKSTMPTLQHKQKTPLLTKAKKIKLFLLTHTNMDRYDEKPFHVRTSMVL